MTDNDAVNQNCWKHLKTIFPQLITIGCAAHNLNLVIQWLVNLAQFSGLMTIVNLIVHFFTKTYHGRAVFEKRLEAAGGASNLISPVITRWSTHANCLKRLLERKDEIVLAVLDFEEKKLNVEKPIWQAIVPKIQSTDFWASVSQLLSVIEPISMAITRLEDHKGTLSQVEFEFQQIRSQFSKMEFPSKAEMMMELTKRKAIIFSGDEIFVAFVLDPRYHHLYTSPISDRAEKWLTKHYGDTMWTEVLNFRLRQDQYNCASAWKRLNDFHPALWWKGNFQNTPLFPIAYKLLSIAATSAAAERNWSAFGFIDEPLRASLTNEHLCSLVQTRNILKIKGTAF